MESIDLLLQRRLHANEEQATVLRGHSKAICKGYSRNFDFTAYVTIHQQAHQDLTRLGKPVPKNKKVRDFLNGITDPQCMNIKLGVLSNHTYMNDFLHAVNFCASAIALLIKNTSDHRQISDLNYNVNRGRRGRGSGRRDAYRGGYAGRRGGHNNDIVQGGRNFQGRGRGRARGRDQGGRGEDQSISRGYSAEDWQNMSQADRNRVYRARDRLETARTVAALLCDQPDNDPDDLSSITPSIANPGNGQNDNNTSRRNMSEISFQGISNIMNCRQGGIGAYSSGNRKSAMFSAFSHHSAQQHYCHAELDSHADTSGVNDVAYVLEYLGKVTEVYEFSKSLSTMEDVPIVKAAFAYDDHITGETLIVIVNQALYFEDKLSNVLLNPNQM